MVASGKRAAVLCVMVVILSGLLPVPPTLCQHRDERSGSESMLSSEARPPGAVNPYTAGRTFRSFADAGTGLAIVAILVIAFLVIVSRMVKQPSKVTVLPLAPPRETIPDESDFFRRTTNKLEKMGFSHELDFTVPDLPQEGVFRFMSFSRGLHTVLVAEVLAKQRKAEKSESSKVCYLEFQALLDNGCRINTSNCPVRNHLTPPRTYLVTRHPSIADPRRLFDVHRTDVERMRNKMGGRLWPQDPERLKEDFQDEWQDLMAYQAKTGLLKLEKDGATYHAKAALLLRALTPRFLSRAPAWWALPVPLLTALVMGIVVWAVPHVVSLLKLQHTPFLARELEAYSILVLAGVPGYLVGPGGAILGALSFVPTIVFMNQGPISYVWLIGVAFLGGALGEKLCDPQPDKDLFASIGLAAILLVALGFWT